MRIARRLLLAVAVLLPMALTASRAEALMITGVTVTPSTVSPGENLTVSGPFVASDCIYGTVLASNGFAAPEYKFAQPVAMTTSWTVTSSEFRMVGLPAEIEPGQYQIGIECFDDRGNQTLHTTNASFTVVANEPPQPADPNAYQALTPARLLDTRPGQKTVDGQFEAIGAIGPGITQPLQVAGRGGVAASGVKAVVLNITATGPTAAGFLTVFPSGEAKPLASNLNFGPGQTVPNLVVAKVGADGRVSIYNDTGFTHLIADVTGYFPSTSAFTPLSPARLYDSRPGQPIVDGVGSGGPLPGGTTQPVQATGRGGVPASGVSAVILNVTATGSAGAGFVTVFPSGESRPLASNLNLAPGQTVANQVITKVGADGRVFLYTDAATHLIADVAGWFPTTSTYHPLTPARLLDTRPGQTTVDFQDVGEGQLPSSGVKLLKVTGRGGVPSTGVGAVVLNVTATSPTGAGFISVYPRGELKPLASNLNFVPGQTVANLVVAKVGTNGQVSIYNEGGSTHVIADVAGWFAR